MSNNIEFGEDIQRVFLSYMLADPTAFTLSQNILKPEYFDSKLSKAVEYVKTFASDHKTLPTHDQIHAYTGVKVENFGAASEQQSEWFLTHVEKFCRHRALELAILDGVDLLNKGETGQIEKRVKEAVTISLMRDLGTSYFKDPLSRLARLRDKSNFVSTGWAALDKKLYGGFTKGSLNIFAGGSGSGKSLFLQNMALNYAFAGLNVIYITLELSEDLVNLRLDAMVTGVGTKDVMSDIEKTALQVAMIGKNGKVGDLKVKKFPEAGTTSNDIRAYLKEYEIQEGKKPDALIVDYLDLMHPNNAKIDVSSMFTKDKYVSEELRSIGSDWDIPVVSASQLNRQSVEAQEFDHSHIAGGISKINTADNVFAIFTSMNMKERGVYQLQFLKTRSAGAVGQKIELSYNPDSLRITNGEEQDDGIEIRSKTSDEIRDELKAKLNSTRPQGGDNLQVVQKPAGTGPITSQITVSQSEPSSSPKKDLLGSLINSRTNSTDT